MEIELPEPFPCIHCGRLVSGLKDGACLGCRMALAGMMLVCPRDGESVSPDMRYEHEVADEADVWLRRRGV